ncbi:cyclin-T1-4-like [Gossypium australe]|uniref:Cyclin-T1-4-like n=1 Tax=Gossypium australe TaxID=47621 RepID=A0A5B6VFU3_9ROSI|nr:cyclin-T1-4-like [Gossypium australe]
MSFTRNCRMQGSVFQDDYRYPFNRNNYNNYSSDNYRNGNWSSDPTRIFNHAQEFLGQFGEHNRGYHHAQPNCAPSLKRRKFSAATWGDSGRNYQPYSLHCPTAQLEPSNFIPPPMRSTAEASTSVSNKRDRSQLEDDESVFMSRDDIERYSPSRRDGIDALRETHLRYSYCAFIQNLGLQLELPQTTIGTAMVLCHRFFVRRSHACHDRFLIATAALFLAAKSEETPRPLNNVLKTSCEIFHKQDITFLSYILPVDWFEQYRERVIEAEQMILTTLNFELNVQHPYAPLTSILNKLGLSQTALVNLALNLGHFRVSVHACMILLAGGLMCCSWKLLLRSSLWLQFKPHHIAAGAAYLAAKFLNFDLASYHDIWREFQTTPAILQGNPSYMKGLKLSLF